MAQVGTERGTSAPCSNHLSHQASPYPVFLIAKSDTLPSGGLRILLPVGSIVVVGDGLVGGGVVFGGSAMRHSGEEGARDPRREKEWGEGKNGGCGEGGGSQQC